MVKDQLRSRICEWFLCWLLRVFPVIHLDGGRRTDLNALSSSSPSSVQSNEEALSNQGTSTEGAGGGVEPEVVLDRDLDQVKLEQQGPTEPVKRALTPAAENAKHRGARDHRLRETLCWWIANGRTCLDGDQCNFKHVVPDEREQTVSGTGALLLGPASEQNVTGGWCFIARSVRKTGAPKRFDTWQLERCLGQASRWRQMGTCLEQASPPRQLGRHLGQARGWGQVAFEPLGNVWLE